MKTLLSNIQAVIAALVGTVTVDDEQLPRPYDNPVGGQRAIRYYTGSMPDKRETDQQEEDFPFCLIKPTGFTLDRMGRNQKVEIIFGLFEAGDKDDGLDMIDDLLFRLSAAPRQVFTTYKLIGDFTGSVVTENHPYYSLTMSGEFRKAKV